MATELMKDLPDDPTYEQMDTFISQAITAQNEAEAKTSEDNSKQTPAGDETPADQDDSAILSDEAGEGTVGKETEGRDWLDEDLKADAAAMGITDEELSDFTSREELERAMRFFDRAAMKAGREAGEGETAKGAADSSKEGQSPRGPDGKFVAKEGAKEGDKQGEDAGYKVNLPEEYFDEAIVNEFRNLSQHYEGRIKAMEERFSQIESAAVEERFDTIVDTLGQADLFGETGKESAKQLENRKKLFEEYSVYLAGLEALGRGSRLDKSSVSRVMNMAFADQLSKQQRKNLTRRVSAHSQLRMGGGATRSTDGKYSGPPERDPELLEYYKQLEQENG